MRNARHQFLLFCLPFFACNFIHAQVHSWITRSDRSALLEKQPPVLHSNEPVKSDRLIKIDTSASFQMVDGFGYSLTGSSASHIYGLAKPEREKLLRELFGRGEGSVGISFLRISIGSSDLDATVFSYDDIPKGGEDMSLQFFSLRPDSAALLPLLKEILAISPDLKIMASPWSPPLWMKSNRKSKGGSLLPKYYDVYARYFVRYIQSMTENGIRIHAITPQNEPLHPGNNPSMFMSAEEQTLFIKNHLGPLFRKSGIATRIVVYDHNCNRPDYPITILNDTIARQFVDGSAFHLYEGDISALSTVHAAHPDKKLYFTEQWTGAKGDFGEDLRWHIKNVIIGAMRNWSRIALEWNLASDARYEPHTPGGCTECKGALTIDNAIERNVSYYIIAHAAKFVPPGSVRIASTEIDALPNVAFRTPSGQIVLIVLNETNGPVSFSTKIGGQYFSTGLPAESVATFVW